MGNIQYYIPENIPLGDNTVLCSGQCTKIKMFFLTEQLKRAAERGYKVIIIDFTRAAGFSGILYSCGFDFHSQHTFDAEEDNYAPIEVPIREAISNLRMHSRRLGSAHSSYAQMTAFLSLLMSLEHPSEKSRTIRQLLRKFGDQTKLEEILLPHIRNRTITEQEAKEVIQTYLECAASGANADILLSELKFLFTPNIEAEPFSLSALHRGEAAVLYASENNSIDLNDYYAEFWTADLIRMAKHDPLFIVINAGHHSQIDRMYELTETLSNKPNVNLFYSSYDLFSGIGAEKSVAFAKLFRYNIYGRHAYDSAETITGMFVESWMKQSSYAVTQNKRIMKESVSDKIFQRDRTTTVTTSLIKEREIPAYSIVRLADHEFILFDTFTCTCEERSAMI